MKPEKVKSRWRRHSELETRHKLSVSMGIDIEKSINMKETCITLLEMKKNSNTETCGDSSEEEKITIPVYDSLDENLYLFERKRSKRKKEVRRMLCDCSLSKEDCSLGVLGCRDECLNRLLMIECGSRCATGEACSNKRFQKRLYAKVKPFNTDKKGWGLKLLEDIQMGTFVIEYVGEVLNTQEFKQRVKQYAREKSNHYYFMALKSDEIIDATNKGNLSRFMNHSCDPNCVTQKWTVNGELRIGFFAKTDLKAGEELTFDYQFQRYGREAQKCHCDSDVCSGYIGVSNQISLEVNSNKYSNKHKKTSEEKKIEDLEDLILEKEIEKLSENGGLRNKEETLLLARLMVRAEDFHSRDKLLDILLGTSEFGCLRLFLDYHGLSLLWSWMVDVTDLKLKTKILQVLSAVPVPNKTMLFDTKVYSVVERWASVNTLIFPCKEREQSFPATCDKKPKTSFDTSDSDTPIISDIEESSILNDDLEISCHSDEENGAVLEEDSDLDSTEFSNLAHNLLSSWKELKEEFRIPRREPPKKISKGISQSNRRSQKNMCRSCRILKASFCTHISKFIKNKDMQKSKSKSKFFDSEARFQKSHSNGSHILTKKERREQFARIAEQEEKKKKTIQDQQLAPHINFNNSYLHQYAQSEYNSNNFSYGEPHNGNNFKPYYHPNTLHRNPVLLLSSSTDEHLNVEINSVDNAIYEQNVVYQPSNSQVPFIGTPLPVISHQTSSVLPDSSDSALSVVTNINTQPILPTIALLNGDLSKPSSTIIHSSVYTSEQNFCNNSRHELFYTSPHTTQYISNNDHYINGQTDNSHIHYSTHHNTQGLVGQTLSYLESNGTPTKAVSTKLPPNWKTATDADGNIYYYHIVTRQTQWDPPELRPEDLDEDTPTYDEPKHPKKRSTTTAAADTSSSRDVAKKIKELFRSKMSSFVVQCLNPYHRDDCRVGKITSNEDFKHLARKLTHFVMAKELKHCKQVEDLECNENVKHKARDYIHKYMAKFGKFYKKEKFYHVERFF